MIEPFMNKYHSAICGEKKKLVSMV